MASAMPSGAHPEHGSSRFFLHSATSTVVLFGAQRFPWLEGHFPQAALDSEWVLGTSVTVLTLAVCSQWWQQLRPHLPDVRISWRRDEDKGGEAAGGDTG